MSSIGNALEQIKDRFTDSLSAQLIEQACQEVKYQHRKRMLDPVATLQLFCKQILHGNIAVAHLKRLTPFSCSETAYSKARRRLPRTLIHHLQQAVTNGLRQDDPKPHDSRWLGHRVFLIDGSSFSMPDTDELRQHFGQPKGQKEGCGFPVAHLMALFDAKRGYLTHASALPLNTHDMSQAAACHADLQEGDVLVGDRAFASFEHLALCQKRGIGGLFRAHQRQIIDFRPGRPHGRKGQPKSRWLESLGPDDQLVEYRKPSEKPDWMSQQEHDRLPSTLVIREMRYRVKGRGGKRREIVVVTTLTDAKAYPASALADLYKQRWSAETNLRHLKQTMEMDELRCKRVAGVQKELEMYVLAYNLVRQVMEEGACRQRVGVSRISFVDALRWFRNAKAGEEVAKLVVNRERPGREEPRAVKRRPKQYDLLQCSRKQWHQDRDAQDSDPQGLSSQAPDPQSLVPQANTP